MKMRIVYQADMTAPSGYSRAARAHGRALLEQDLDVQFVNHRHDQTQVSLDRFWREELPKRLVPEGTRGDVKIWHETPEFYNPLPGTKNVAIVAWETDRIPSVDVGGNPRWNWTKQLNRMDQVWVPCRQNRRALERSGVAVPIHVVPHPIRLEDYPLETEPRIHLDKDRLNLLSVFQWQPRKDPLRLLLGFYGSKVPAQLVLKTYGWEFGTGAGNGEIIRAIREVKEGFHVPPLNAVVPVFDLIPDEEMSGIYASCDAYVTTSRGEGFCLPAIETMAMGKPLLAPSHTAFEDVFETDWPPGIALSYHLEPVTGMEHSPWYRAEQRWGQVNVDSLMEALKTLASWKRTGTLKRVGERARETVGRLFDPEAIGQQMKQLLEIL